MPGGPGRGEQGHRPFHLEPRGHRALGGRIMELLVFKAGWGMAESLPRRMERIAEAGYDGVEEGLPPPEQKAEFAELLARHGLRYLPMIFTQGPDHLASFERQLEEAAAWKPLKVTCHSAKDHHSHE